MAKSQVVIPKDNQIVHLYDNLWTKAKKDPKVREGRNVAHVKNFKWASVRKEYRRLYLEYHPALKEQILFEQRSKAYGGGNRGLGYAFTMKRYNSEVTWQCTDYIIRHESGWVATVYNRGGSGAYGLGQALPASKMAPYGRDYMTNPITQLKWFYDYTTSRYGSPCGAHNWWIAHNWY